MRKTLFTLGLVALILFPVYASAELSKSDDSEVRALVSIIQQSVSNSDSKEILELISPNASPDLKQKIQNSVDNKNVTYYQNVNSIEELSPTKVKVVGQFSASGREGAKTWNINGLENYFLFEKMDGRWLILESDFQDKINADYVFGMLGNIFKFVMPIFLLLLLLAFWLWMLIDCAKRPIPNKTLWIILIIFLQILGAILYFFIPRRKYIKQAKKNQ